MNNHDFSHVLWLGGSVRSGKTSASAELASRYGLRIYSFDDAEPFHIYRSVPERQPNLIRFMAMTMDERWVLRAPKPWPSTHSPPGQKSAFRWSSTICGACRAAVR